MKLQNLAKFGLVAVVLGGIAAPVMADPYLGEWRYNSVNYGYGRPADWGAERAQRHAIHERREAAMDAMEGDFRDARYHAMRAHQAQRRANRERFEDRFNYGY